jgi:hypothetical protein
MPAKPVEFGKWKFATLTNAKTYIRALVDRYKNGNRITGEDHEFVHALLQLHDESDKKIGVGVDYFFVQRDKVFKGKKNWQFVIKRLDGLSTEFSWPHCLGIKSHSKNVYQALRDAVFEQTSSFKLNKLKSEQTIFCPISGERLTKKNSHTDHEPPFEFVKLVSSWLQSIGMTLDQIKLVESVDNQVVCELQDQKLVDEWAQYHTKNARLRLLSEKANLSKQATPYIENLL